MGAYTFIIRCFAAGNLGFPTSQHEMGRGPEILQHTLATALASAFFPPGTFSDGLPGLDCACEANTCLVKGGGQWCLAMSLAAEPLHRNKPPSLLLYQMPIDRTFTPLPQPDSCHLRPKVPALIAPWPS